MPQLLTRAHRARLFANHASPGDHPPVLKLFTPDANATWLLCDIDSDGRLFGLCDLGLGSPELGYIMLHELETLRGPFCLPVERDRWFSATAPISAYAAAAREAGRIIETLAGAAA